MFPLFDDDKNYFHIYLDPAKSNPPKSVGASLTSITLEWDEVTEGSVLKTYNLYWNDSKGNENMTMNIYKNSKIVESLDQNTKYNFTVEARNERGDGELSESSELETGTQNNSSKRLTTKLFAE